MRSKSFEAKGCFVLLLVASRMSSYILELFLVETHLEARILFAISSCFIFVIGDSDDFWPYLTKSSALFILKEECGIGILLGFRREGGAGFWKKIGQQKQFQQKKKPPSWENFNASNPLYYYVSLCPVSGIRHRPSIRGDRWVIPARGFLKCF